MLPNDPPDSIIFEALHSSRKESNIAIVSSGPPADSGWNWTPGGKKVWSAFLIGQGKGKAQEEGQRM